MPFLVNKPHLRDQEIGNGNSNIKQKLFSSCPLSHAKLYTHMYARAFTSPRTVNTQDEMHEAAYTHTYMK